MKENKNENYELEAVLEQRKYAAALEIAREYYNECKTDYARKMLEAIFPTELAESEDEKIREWLVEMVKELRKANPTNAEHNGNCSEALAYLERQKEPDGAWTEEDDAKVKAMCQEGYLKPSERAWLNKLKNRIVKKEQQPIFKKGDKVIWQDEEFNILDVSGDSYRIGGYILPFYRQNELRLAEQEPAESDAIKGGDFISDGKRVFLVLANVKERNLGETGSTFCEGLILGVDGVVYCNEDDFKKFKRATSDERAKFIHDLKVGVELKKQPAEWSEEDVRKLNRIVEILVEGSRAQNWWETRRLLEIEEMETLTDFLKCLRPQDKQEWSEEYEKRVGELKVFITQCNGFNKANRQKAFELIDALRPKWSEEDEKMCSDIIDYMLPMPLFFESTNGKSDKEYTKEFIIKATEWLKSLRSQRH